MWLREGLHSEEGVATVWLTTSEMGFSLTDEPNTILCPRDVREGKVCDRYLAPAISKFVTSTLAKTGIGTEIDLPVGDFWREYNGGVKSTKTRKVTTSECRLVEMPIHHGYSQESSNASIKNLPWEKDSIARAAYDST